MFKRIALLILCALLTCTACSKDKDTNANKAKSSSSRTVDLGEDNGGDDSAKSKRGAKKGRRANADNADKGGEKLTDEEIARRNDEAAVNPDGSAKRGKPAAQIEAEEAADAEKGPKGHEPKLAKAEEVPAADAPAAEAVADDANSDGFDFADDAAADADAGSAVAEEPVIQERIVQKRQGLNIENLITIKEVREQTGYAGAFAQTDLVGQPSDSRYNVIRLSTNNKNELGFSVQVWKPGNESAASRRFEDLFKQSFGGVKQKDVATDAFMSSHHKLHELAFYDKAKRAVVLISCSESVCKASALKGIASIVQRKL